MAEGISLQSLPLSNPPVSNNQQISQSSPDLFTGSKDFPPLVPPATSIGVSANTGRSYLDCVNNIVEASSATTKLSLGTTKLIDGKSTAFFTSGELKSQICYCESYVVGYFVGKRLPFPTVKDTLSSYWKTKGEFSMTIHGEQMFLFKFVLEEDRKKVLELGSIYFGKNLFLIRPWSISLEQNFGSVTSVPVWIHLRQVPLHLWNQLGLSRIASIVGTPIMTDSPTALKTRMSYARVCVEISVDCSFPTELPVQIDDTKFVVKAEYPWKPSSCSHCKSFGHSSKKCRLNSAPKVYTAWVPKSKKSTAVSAMSAPATSPENEVVSQIIAIVVDRDQTENMDGVQLSSECPPSTSSIGVQPSSECPPSTSPIVGEDTATNSIADMITASKDKEEVTQLRTDGGTDGGSNGSESGVVLGSQPVAEKWKTYTKKKKNSNRKHGTSLQVLTCNLNSFSALNFEDNQEDSEEVFREDGSPLQAAKESRLKDIGKTNQLDLVQTKVAKETIGTHSNYKVSHKEDVGLNGNEMEDEEDLSEESEFESDQEEMGIEKLKTIEDVSKSKPWSKDEHMNKLLNCSSLLGVQHGGKEAEVKNIYEEIVDRYKTSKQDKEAKSLYLEGVSGNKDLGRGKRTSTKKKF